MPCAPGEQLLLAWTGAIFGSSIQFLLYIHGLHLKKEKAAVHFLKKTKNSVCI